MNLPFLNKKVEKILKEAAIDCPLNMAKNIFKEDLEKYKDCIEPGQKKTKDQTKAH